MTNMHGQRPSRSLVTNVPRFGLSLGLLFCSPALAATVLAPLSGGTYQSVIVDWPQGQTGTVQLSAADTGVLAEGTIDATGKFSIVLPGQDVVTPKLASVNELFTQKSNYGSTDGSCQGTGTASPTTAKIKEYDLNAFSGGRLLAGLKLKSTTRIPYPVGQGYSALTYFDTATTLDGTVRCTGFNAVFKGTVPAGWSLPSGVVTDISAENVYTDVTTSDSLPATVTWHLYDELVGIGIGVDTDKPGPTGYMLTRISPGAPAEKAGILFGDVLVQVNGQDVSALNWNQIALLIRGEAGTTVTLGVQRGTSPDLVQIPVTRQLIRVP
jgi:hypothetical protein